MNLNMSNNEKLSHKQILGSFYKLICLPWGNGQFIFVFCFRLVAQKHHSRFSTATFMKLSYIVLELDMLSYSEFFPNAVCQKVHLKVVLGF